MKSCKICKEVKDLNSFHKHYIAKDGLSGNCKNCTAKFARSYYLRNKEKIKNRSLLHRQNNPQELTRYHLKSKYNLTLEQYNSLYSKQHGCCAICDRHFTQLVVDHNHKTNSICKLLCNSCNTAIGLLQENAGIALSAARYIERYKQEFR